MYFISMTAFWMRNSRTMSLLQNATTREVDTATLFLSSCLSGLMKVGRSLRSLARMTTTKKNCRQYFPIWDTLGFWGLLSVNSSKARLKSKKLLSNITLLTWNLMLSCRISLLYHRALFWSYTRSFSPALLKYQLSSFSFLKGLALSSTYTTRS